MTSLRSCVRLWQGRHRLISMFDFPPVLRPARMRPEKINQPFDVMEALKPTIIPPQIKRISIAPYPLALAHVVHSSIGFALVQVRVPGFFIAHDRALPGA